MTDDWLDKILATLAEDLISYDQHMTKTGAPNVRFVHKYLEKAKAEIIAQHQRIFFTHYLNALDPYAVEHNGVFGYFIPDETIKKQSGHRE